VRHLISLISGRTSTNFPSLVLDLSPWQNDLIPGWKEVLTLQRGQLRYSQKSTNGLGICFCVAVWFPARQDPDQKHGNMPRWVKRAIAWTMIPPKNPSGGPSKSINHLSTLPDGWIPDDGVDFFKQFILCLKDRWFTECNLAEGDQAKRVSSPGPIVNLRHISTFLTLFNRLIKTYSVATNSVGKGKALTSYLAWRKMLRRWPIIIPSYKIKSPLLRSL
jgi:hypothetical protein